MDPVIFTNILVATTFLGNLGAVLFLLVRFTSRTLYVQFTNLIGRYALWLAFIISFFSSVGSYAYGEITGYAACILCWFQRIFMYPLPFLFGLSIIRKEKVVLPYTLLLSWVGALIALYQWIKDMLALYTDWSLACPAVSGLPSCDKIFVDALGYITIPMIAFNAFVWLIIVINCARKNDQIKK